MLVKKSFFLLLLPYFFILHGEKVTVLTFPVEQSCADNWYHPGVTHSLLRGLQELGVDFNFNPSKKSAVGTTVVVLTNIEALKQAIRWKKNKRIKKLLVGPNLMVRANEHSGILSSPEIDVCLVPSEWVKFAYLDDAPALKNRIQSWPVGVEVKFWEPTTRKNTQDVIVYWKTEPVEFYLNVAELLQKNNFNPIKIQYGSYSATQYKEALQKALFAVFISCSESQGLALAEAWAMDVPTLVWSPTSLTAHGRHYAISSACPYLTAECGKGWQNLDELKELIQNLGTSHYSPRNWVLNNMTDAISAKKLLTLIEAIH